VLLGPANFEKLLDDPTVVQRFAADEFMPYWAEFWPAATLLAEVVAAWGPAPAEGAPRVLEVGCGLGLVGLVAHRLGYPVTLTDYEDDALMFVRASAAANGLPEPATAFVDWRQEYPALRSERIVAAEVLYERRILEPISAFLKAHLLPGGEALIVDRYRQTADAFPAHAERAGLVVESAPLNGVAADGTAIAARLFTVRHA
jgi:predicted nicotinamide N-methyase